MGTNGAAAIFPAFVGGEWLGFRGSRKTPHGVQPPAGDVRVPVSRRRVRSRRAVPRGVSPGDLGIRQPFRHLRGHPKGDWCRPSHRNVRIANVWSPVSFSSSGKRVNFFAVQKCFIFFPNEHTPAPGWDPRGRGVGRLRGVRGERGAGPPPP